MARGFGCGSGFGGSWLIILLIIFLLLNDDTSLS
jgi:hypothetical protein